MISREGRRIRTAAHIKLVPNSKSAAGEPLDLSGTEVRNDRAPLPNSSGTDIQRSRDIRGALKVINNVLFEHDSTFTIVKTQPQPRCQSKDLTLVAMDKFATIADRLREAMREADETSASELARACDVSPAAVHKWLNGGKMSADSLAAAARALGVREEWLRTGKLPRDRAASADESLEEVIVLLDNLKEPLAALALAIEKIGKARPSTKKRESA
jgi:transcriptional regulator with XRE-family HTH domain